MRAGRWCEEGRDRGAATVWVVVVMAVLGVVCGAVLAMAQVVVARHRAGGAADLAALAAADRWAEGSSHACEGAVRVAEEQGARVLRCVLRGQVSEVAATSSAGPFSATVRSRAGPGHPPPRAVPPPVRGRHASLPSARAAAWGPPPVPRSRYEQARRFAAEISHPPTRLPRDVWRE
ncbi:Rv3654c family TadE-like protein [Streptomyces sp. NPDC058308]|uniref:Rv3654c family TadE-like protein n=1 Tax=Streptomyces sp. NPDC058308 TaxID=3346440 RepID=UPI0036EDDAC3